MSTDPNFYIQIRVSLRKIAETLRSERFEVNWGEAFLLAAAFASLGLIPPRNTATSRGVYIQVRVRLKQGLR